MVGRKIFHNFAKGPNEAVKRACGLTFWVSHPLDRIVGAKEDIESVNNVDLFHFGSVVKMRGRSDER
jgi:hypothetical protein